METIFTGCVARIVSRQAEGEETQPKPHVIVRLWPLNVRNLVCPSLVEKFCAARLKHTSPYPARQKRQLGCARPNSALSKVLESNSTTTRFPEYASLRLLESRTLNHLNRWRNQFNYRASVRSQWPEGQRREPSVRCTGRLGRATRRALVAPRPLVARKGLVVRPVEEILGGVRHSRHLAWEVPGIGGGVAADGVHPLDERHPVENTTALVEYRSAQQRGDGVGVRGAAVEYHADHFAAADAFPGWTGIVNADFTLIPGVGEQHRLWHQEGPTRAVPAVDLHALRVGMKGDLGPRGHMQVLAIARSGARLSLPGSAPAGATSVSRSSDRTASVNSTECKRNACVVVELFIMIPFPPSFVAA